MEDDKKKVTFNLSVEGQRAMEELEEATGESKTLIMNQAIIAYAYLKAKGQHGTLTFIAADGQRTEIKFL